METRDLIIIIAFIALAGFIRYRKYIAKKQNEAGTTTGSKSTLTGNDDYEPYSGR